MADIIRDWLEEVPAGTERIHRLGRLNTEEKDTLLLRLLSEQEDPELANRKFTASEMRWNLVLGMNLGFMVAVLLWFLFGGPR